MLGMICEFREFVCRIDPTAAFVRESLPPPYGTNAQNQDPDMPRRASIDSTGFPNIRGRVAMRLRANSSRPAMVGKGGTPRSAIPRGSRHVTSLTEGLC